MTEKPKGFYIGRRESDYRTLSQIRRDTSHDEIDTEDVSFSEVAGMMKQRQKDRQRLIPRKTKAKVLLPDTHVYVALIGDTHLTNETTDIDRLQAEVLYLSSVVHTYVLLFGDLVDGYFFMPAQQDAVGSLGEETVFIYKLFEQLKGKILAAWGGDHDYTWAEKTGASLYHRFTDTTGALFFHGLSHLDLVVGNQSYAITGAHRLPGFSMYNNVHGQMRAVNFDGARGADIVVSGHTHRKGHSRQPVKDRDGSKMVDFVSLGAYKTSDRYSRKLGFGEQDYDEMGGYGLVLRNDEKRVDVYDDIRRGLDDFQDL